MEFINETNCAAELFRSAFKEDALHNSLLARIRYELVDHTHLIPAPKESMLTDIRRDRMEDEYGIIEPDDFFGRTGTDLIVLGSAVSTKGRVTSLPVTVSVGPYRQSLLIIGNRIWEKRLLKFQELVPSTPESFEVMPISYQNAFGGKAKTEYGELPFANNPMGKGYYLQAEEAIGNPLPNVENPLALIKKWNDQPEPVGLAPYPSNWGLRLMKIVSVSEEAIELIPENGIFDRAHPALSGKRLQGGQILSIVGMSQSGIIKFQLPVCPFEVEVRLGNKVYVRELLLEEVLVDLRYSRVDFSYRKNFDYAFVPHQIRKTVLRWKNLKRGELC